MYLAQEVGPKPFSFSLSVSYPDNTLLLLGNLAWRTRRNTHVLPTN
jgi:hypothetical protein